MFMALSSFVNDFVNDNLVITTIQIQRTHVTKYFNSVVYTVNASTKKQFPCSNRMFWRRSYPTLVHPMLQTIKVNGSPGFLVPK